MMTVMPASTCVTGRCDGCGDEIEVADYAFIVVLKGEVTFQFHDECFEVYNRISLGRA